MRSDMFEVIIERPRVDRGRGEGKGRRREPVRQQEAPTWEPVSRGRGTKCLNENLAPLRRFLRSRVGRPWDAVRSEICQLITPRSAVQMHVCRRSPRSGKIRHVLAQVEGPRVGSAPSA
jgi:hypothetical protein